MMGGRPKVGEECDHLNYGDYRSRMRGGRFGDAIVREALRRRRQAAREDSHGGVVQGQGGGREVDEGEERADAGFKPSTPSRAVADPI
jgi:hypothetical protein